MTSGAAEDRFSRGRAVRMAGWFALTSALYLAWKVFVGLIYGAGQPYVVFQLAAAVLVAIVLFVLGLVMGFVSSTVPVPLTRQKVATIILAGFLAGYMADLLLGLAAAHYLSQVGEMLGEGYQLRESMWSTADFKDQAAFALYSLAGGITGGLAGYLFGTRR